MKETLDSLVKDLSFFIDNTLYREIFHPDSNTGSEAPGVITDVTPEDLDEDLMKMIDQGTPVSFSTGWGEWT